MARFPKAAIKRCSMRARFYGLKIFNWMFLVKRFTPQPWHQSSFEDFCTSPSAFTFSFTRTLLCLDLYSKYECAWLLAHVGTPFLLRSLPRATANLPQKIEDSSAISHVNLTLFLIYLRVPRTTLASRCCFAWFCWGPASKRRLKPSNLNQFLPLLIKSLNHTFWSANICYLLGFDPSPYWSSSILGYEGWYSDNGIPGFHCFLLLPCWKYLILKMEDCHDSAWSIVMDDNGWYLLTKNHWWKTMEDDSGWTRRWQERIVTIMMQKGLMPILSANTPLGLTSTQKPWGLEDYLPLYFLNIPEIKSRVAATYQNQDLSLGGGKIQFRSKPFWRFTGTEPPSAQQWRMP